MLGTASRVSNAFDDFVVIALDTNAKTSSPVALGKLKIIVLMVLWSQGKEPDALMFDDLFGDDDQEPRLLH